MPKIHPTAWVAPGAFVRGDVTIDEQANIWYNAVLRGDQESITVGKATSVQDNCVLHGDAGCNVVVGQYVTVGHGAVLHGCTVEDNCLIGMNAVVLDHAVIGAGSIVGAGAVVAAGTIVPPKSLVVGVPGEAIAAGKLQNIVQDLALIHSMGVKIVLVHGFRPQVNEQLAAKGQQSKYYKGVRITDAFTLDCALEAAGQLRY